MKPVRQTPVFVQESEQELLSSRSRSRQTGFVSCEEDSPPGLLSVSSEQSVTGKVHPLGGIRPRMRRPNARSHPIEAPVISGAESPCRRLQLFRRQPRDQAMQLVIGGLGIP